jgi:hypothetical protein
MKIDDPHPLHETCRHLCEEAAARWPYERRPPAPDLPWMLKAVTLPFMRWMVCFHLTQQAQGTAGTN